MRRQHGDFVRAGAIPLVAVLTLIAGLIATISPASAALARPTELTPDGYEISGSPVLSWKHVTDATSYNVEVSSSSGFETLVFSVTTPNRHATPTMRLPGGELYWRVRSVSSSGTSAWSVAMFETADRPGPGLKDGGWGGQVLEQPGNPPVLSWDAVAGATGYEVEVDGTDSNFVNATKYTTQTTSLVVPDPQENGVYKWHVRAILGTGINTSWSPEDTYNIGALPVVGGDVLPENSPDTNVSDVVFDWDPVPGAVTYDLQVDDDDSFSAPVDTVVVKGTRYSRPQTYNNNQYWWRVRARNVFGKAQEWSEVPVRQFRRHWPENPTLTYPADGEGVGDDFYYQWTPVPLASRYRLEVGRDPNFSPGQYETCFTTETTYTPGYTRYQGLGRTVQADKCMPSMPGETYYWQVQALDGSDKTGEVNGIYSQIHSFRYEPGMVRTLSPKATSPGTLPAVDIPTLRWEPFQDAVKYKVSLNWEGGSRSATTHSYSWTPTGISLDPAKGPFEWKVRAVDADGSETAVPVVGDQFNLSGETPTTGRTPLAPIAPTAASSATPRFPTLKWEPHPDAAYYQVHIASDQSTTFTTLGDKFYYSEGSDISSTYLLPGSYKWFVTAYTSGGATLGAGSQGTFQISDLAAASGQQIALHGQGLDMPGVACDLKLTLTLGDVDTCSAMRDTPVLDWAPVPDAGYYMVYVSRDREFTNMVYGSKAYTPYIPTTQNTRWNPVWSMPDSQAGDAYYWYIRPCKAPGACAPDPTSAGHAFDKRSNQVQQVSPANGAPVQNDVTFTWDDYLATNTDPTFADANTQEQASQAARSYHLQVGTTPAFTTIVDDVTVDQTTYTAFNKTYPEGKLYWRVQPVDGAGNQLTWGPAMEFTRSADRPAFDSPVGGVAGPTQPLRWHPANFAASYDVEVYKNADTTASSTNRVLSANSKQVAYSFAKPLPASTANYVWRVRAVDADRRKGLWTQWASFKVSRKAPTLSGSAGQVLGARDAVFEWEALPGAASYKFERRNSGATYSTDNVRTSNTAFAPTRVIASGSWRVTALDSAGATLGVSAWRDFTVGSTTTDPTPTTPKDTTRPKVVKKSPLTYARPKANFTAKFSERVKGVSGTTVRLFKGKTRIKARVTLSADKRVAKLDPARPMKRRAKYTLRLSSGIRDMAGNRLRGTSWTVKVR